jgi:hypothetical protein
MHKRRIQLKDKSELTLRDIRLATIEIACEPCQRREYCERSKLVKRFGANASLMRIRRRMALGCERLCHPDGDRCGTRFPYLDEL